VSPVSKGSGPQPINPNVVLKPGSPVYDDGMRIEPPPSLPVHAANIPDATAAAEPPEDPPGVASGFHGLRVIPCSGEFV
jgi:hypothetical protein